MFKPLSTLLFLITLLTAFAGQSMAYHFVVSYDDTSDLQTKAQQQTFVNDNDGSNASEDIDDCCEVECCEGGCICPANTCTSVVYLDSSLTLSEIVFLRESLLSSATKATHFIATSLYRPPIFTS